MFPEPDWWEVEEPVSGTSRSILARRQPDVPPYYRRQIRWWSPTGPPEVMCSSSVSRARHYIDVRRRQRGSRLTVTLTS